MSLWTFQTRLLTRRPKVCENKKSIIIKTGFKTSLSLFLYTRRVEITPSKRILEFTHRRAYFYKLHTIISFKDVSHIDYAFDSRGTEWGLTSSYVFGRQDQNESFKISVVTKNNGRYPVCSYKGKGAVNTGWTGVLLGGDELIDFAGTQADESRKLAGYIASIIGVTVGKPLSTKKMAKCPQCGRPVSLSRMKCLYCSVVINKVLSEIANRSQRVPP